MDNPWKRLSSREIYQNPWIRVREDQVITPHGKDGIYGVVEAKPAIGVVALTESLDTYLVGQYRYPLDQWSWEIPEGGGHDGEEILNCAKRELKEETGLSAEKWTFLDTMYTSNCFTNEIGHVFLAEELTQGSAEPDETELLEVKRVPFLEAYRMVLECEIKDSLSIVALFRVQQHLLREGRL